jgi:aspartate aminotransferase-like enzyme
MPFDQYVEHVNAEKIMFTPGPGALHTDNLLLSNCFGRNDPDYQSTFSEVMDSLLKMTGQSEIATAQGSAMLAIEIAIRNFVKGRVLVISTGYYSERLRSLCERSPFTSEVQTCNWNEIERIDSNFNWIVCCFTETSTALRLDIDELNRLKKRAHAKLFFDATGSIGLETGHELADVVAFSSCKGLFGLTGACFVAHKTPVENLVEEFYLNLENHKQRCVTGPYHTIQSLLITLRNHTDISYSVKANKKRFINRFSDHLTVAECYQPLLCTGLNRKVSSRNPKVILYTPRLNIAGSVVCHLGELHLGKHAQGAIIDLLEFQ